MAPQLFPKYLSDTRSFLSEILANPKLRIDTLTNVLKFLKSSQIFDEEGLEIRLNLKN